MQRSDGLATPAWGSYVIVESPQGGVSHPKNPNTDYDLGRKARHYFAKKAGGWSQNMRRAERRAERQLGKKDIKQALPAKGKPAKAKALSHGESHADSLAANAEQARHWVKHLVATKHPYEDDIDFHRHVAYVDQAAAHRLDPVKHPHPHELGSDEHPDDPEYRVHYMGR